jgi:hypothetical protein
MQEFIVCCSVALRANFMFDKLTRMKTQGTDISWGCDESASGPEREVFTCFGAFSKAMAEDAWG